MGIDGGRDTLKSPGAKTESIQNSENGASDSVKCRIRRLEDIERVRAVRGRVPALLAVLADDL